jgi:hypothetical protein
MIRKPSWKCLHCDGTDDRLPGLNICKPCRNQQIRNARHARDRTVGADHVRTQRGRKGLARPRATPDALSAAISVANRDGIPLVEALRHAEII